MLWRGVGYEGPAPPEPWPGRHSAFLTACAMYAGHRENDIKSIVQGFTQGAANAAHPKVPHPMRRGSSG